MQKTIGGLEGLQIHPLDASPMTKMDTNSRIFADSLITSVFANAIFGNQEQRARNSSINSNYTSNIMSDTEAIKFFGITKEDINMAKRFTQ